MHFLLPPDSSRLSQQLDSFSLLQKPFSKSNHLLWPVTHQRVISTESEREIASFGFPLDDVADLLCHFGNSSWILHFADILVSLHHLIDVVELFILLEVDLPTQFSQLINQTRLNQRIWSAVYSSTSLWEMWEIYKNGRKRARGWGMIRRPECKMSREDKIKK